MAPPGRVEASAGGLGCARGWPVAIGVTTAIKQVMPRSKVHSAETEARRQTAHVETTASSGEANGKATGKATSDASPSADDDEQVDRRQRARGSQRIQLGCSAHVSTRRENSSRNGFEHVLQSFNHLFNK